MNLSIFPGTGSAVEPLTEFGDLAPARRQLSILINVIPSQTGSLANTTLTIFKKLPPAQNGRFSFRELLSVLDAEGRSAFDHHRQLQDAALRERHERGEISSLFFYRSLARMTQEELAERARSRQAFISQLEKRRRPLTWKQATKLAAVLGVQPTQLMEHS